MRDFHAVLLQEMTQKMVDICSLKLIMQPFLDSLEDINLCITSKVIASYVLCVHLIPLRNNEFNVNTLHIGKNVHHKNNMSRIFCDPCQWQTETWLDKFVSRRYLIYSNPVW